MRKLQAEIVSDKNSKKLAIMFVVTEELERLGCKNDEGQTITREWCENQNDTLWINQKVNFDNVAIGYLALFQVVSNVICSFLSQWYMTELYSKTGLGAYQSFGLKILIFEDVLCVFSESDFLL